MLFLAVEVFPCNYFIKKVTKKDKICLSGGGVSIFYVSKWRNNKKRYKIEYDVAVTSSLRVESQN